MEFQYSDAPQLSQPIPLLRQTRLQQLREERMRRQQRHMQSPDATMARQIPEGKPALSHQVSLDWSLDPANMPEELMPAQHPMADMPVRESTVRPSSVEPKEFPKLDQASAIPASTSSQDTGMLSKVRMGRATMILTGAFIASRVLGLLRSSLFASVFGAGVISDAYLQAFIIPDLIFQMVAGGALSSAFIPVFTNYMSGEQDSKTAWHIANAALNLAIAIMVVLALVVIIFAGQLVPLYNPHTDPQKLALITSLTRIMLLQAVILGGGVIVNAVLNARQDFLRPAIGTVLYNVGLIAGLLPGVVLAFLGQRGTTPAQLLDFQTRAIYFATYGVIAGALLQVAIQIPGLPKVGMRYQFTLDWKHPGVQQIGKQMIPRIINAAMLNISTIVDRSLILLLAAVVINKNQSDGLVTQYFNAFQLLMLPLGIFGMAVSTAAFPTISDYVARGRMERVRNIITETLRSILSLSIPSAVGLAVLSLPIIQSMFQHGSYTLEKANGTALALSFFAIGLPGHAAVEILTRAFYALRDSTTPVIISVGQFIIKICLGLMLINVAVFGGPNWGLAMLALSTSIAGLTEAVVLFWLVRQRIPGLAVKDMLNFAGRVLMASVVVGAALWIVSFVLDRIPFLITTNTPTLGLGGTLAAVLKLLIEIFVGLFVYIRVSRMLGIEELGPIQRLLNRFKLSWI